MPEYAFFLPRIFPYEEKKKLLFCYILRSVTIYDFRGPERLFKNEFAREGVRRVIKNTTMCKGFLTGRE